jgi:hypothetical protein
MTFDKMPLVLYRREDPSSQFGGEMGGNAHPMQFVVESTRVADRLEIEKEEIIIV